MRIMTYNICSGRRYPESMEIVDLKYCGNVINEIKPDIIGLNETHAKGGSWSEEVEDLAKYLGYDYWYFAPATRIDGSDYGNGIISRYPIKNTEIFPVDDPLVKDEDTYYETRCILKAQLDAFGGLDVYVTHFGLAKEEQKNSVKKLCEIIEENSKQTVLMGDFNVSDDDSVLSPIKQLLNDTMNCKDEFIPTFTSDDPKIKIDYIFVSEDITVENVFATEKIGSDHRGFIADVKISVD